MSQYVYAQEMFDGEVLAAGGTANSSTILVNSMRPLGNFASQLIVTGSGTIKAELYLSINGDDFVLYDTLWEDETATTGKIYNHAFAVGTKFYVKITETGGVSGATVSLWIGVQ